MREERIEIMIGMHTSPQECIVHLSAPHPRDSEYTDRSIQEMSHSLYFYGSSTYYVVYM